MNQQLEDEGYLRVPGFLPPGRAAALAGQLQAFIAEMGERYDREVPNSPCCYNFLPFVRVLVEKLPQVADISGETLLPTYSYSRMYRRHAVLRRHRDRGACEISLTVNLRGDRPWPFHLQAFHAPPVQLLLEPGDALLYLGHQVHHWRESFEGEDCVQMFLHYVRAYGPRARFFFDREQDVEPPAA